jgi:hypothetical protein
MQNQLFVSIDPGFDNMKVIANGQHYKFPFNAVETDERKMSDYGRRDGFILYKDESGTTWRVGQYARGLIFDNKEQQEQAEKMRGFYTEERFTSNEFMVGLRTALAMAINKAGLYDCQASLDIRLIVALPHSCRAKFSSTIVGAAAGEHSFFMRFDDSQEKAYRFTIQESNVYTISQTIAAILGETSDDNGNINEEKFFYLSNGPTLVIDGGYYTVGLVPVSRGGSVDDARAESDTGHAMKMVNVAVEQEIANQRPDIKHYSIEYLLTQDDGRVRYLENGKARTIDLATIRSEKIQEVCAHFAGYLDKKYNNLLDFKYVLVTGGTGACFYQQLLAYYKEAGIMDEEHMMLTSPVINDKPLPIEFSIAAGAYKGLLGKIS